MPNGIIVVNKPAGWTSHDVVAKLRGVFHEKRTGHAGTLDPMATGVLPVFVGRATRGAQFMESAAKAYRAGLKLGMVTDTQDTTGTVISRCNASVTTEELLTALGKFKGSIMQIPPMYSAIKIDGKKLYEIARKGGTVERQPRQVEIFDIELVSGGGDEFIIDIECSKGVYVRTLCHDIGEALGCGGCMSSLVRTRAGSYTLEDSHTMEEILSMAEEGRQNELLRSIDSQFDCPKTCVPALYEKLCRNGGAYPTDLPAGEYLVYSEAKEFLMLGKSENGKMYTVKSFFDV